MSVDSANSLGNISPSNLSEPLSTSHASSRQLLTHTSVCAQVDNSQPIDGREITYWQGICLVISREIGAGIFSTPSIVDRNAGNVPTALVIWFIAGCLSYAGACNAP